MERTDEEFTEVVKEETNAGQQPRCFAEKYYAYDRRFAEYLIDYLLLVVLMIAISSVFGLSDMDKDGIGYNLITFAVMFLYYFIMEVACGRTVGKFLQGLKVVDADGNQPSVGRIALRTLIRFVPFDAFSFLFGKGWGKDGVNGYWHDNWSSTYVVDLKKIKADQDM